MAFPAVQGYNDFMVKRKRIYLDFAAGVSGNPSSPHEEGRAAKELLEEARTSVARTLEVKADDIIFTSGATEANALAILGVARAARVKEVVVPHLLYVPTAHASVVENMRLLAAEGFAVEELPVLHGLVDTKALVSMIRSETVLVSMDAVCGETGTIWNTREVAKVLHDYRALRGGAPWLHIDASQAVYTEKFTRAHFEADLMTLDGGKLGVNGVGCLCVPRTIPLVPLYAGGGQERGLRSGTENVEGLALFAEVLEVAFGAHEQFAQKAKKVRDTLVNHLADIPRIYVYEAPKQAPNILNLSFPGRDTDYLVALLDTAGFAVATRSACETDSEEGSRALFALTGDTQNAKSTLRVSWGPGISEKKARLFVRALTEAVHFIDTTAL